MIKQLIGIKDDPCYTCLPQSVAAGPALPKLDRARTRAAERLYAVTHIHKHPVHANNVTLLEQDTKQ